MSGEDAFDAVVRRAIEEPGGSWVSVLGVVLDGELYRLGRWGPFPDEKSASRDAHRRGFDPDAVLAAVKTGELRPIGAQPAREDDRERTGPAPGSEAEGEEQAGDGRDVDDAGVPADVPADWKATVQTAFVAYDDAQSRLEKARQGRERAVFEAAEAGHAYREIGGWVGMTHQTIASLHRREKARRTEVETETGAGEGELGASGDGADSQHRSDQDDGGDDAGAVPDEGAS